MAQLYLHTILSAASPLPPFYPAPYILQGDLPKCILLRNGVYLETLLCLLVLAVTESLQAVVMNQRLGINRAIHSNRQLIKPLRKGQKIRRKKVSALYPSIRLTTILFLPQFTAICCSDISISFFTRSCGTITGQAHACPTIATVNFVLRGESGDTSFSTASLQQLSLQELEKHAH